MNLEQAEQNNHFEQTSAADLSAYVHDFMAGFNFNQDTNKLLPSGFASAEDLLGGGETKGIAEDVINLAKEDAHNGGQSVSIEYSRQVLRDSSNPALTNAANALTHERAMEILETMRAADGDGSNKNAEINDGRLFETELRGAYVKSDFEQKAAILYGLANFKTFAEAGNWFDSDWTVTALDDIDLAAAKQPKQ